MLARSNNHIQSEIAGTKNSQQILTYLWEANPNVSWDTLPILSRVVIAAPKLVHKIFAHAFDAQPEKLRLSAQNIAFRALRLEEPNGLKVVVPYLSESALRNIIE